MAFYKIANVATGKLLSISGNSVTTLKDNPNVIVYEDTGAAEQNWVIDSLTSGVAIRSVVDPDYGLNISTANDCNVYSLTGNGTIAVVSFISIGSAYRIKTTSSGTELYLTAEASGNVCWTALNDSNYQMWSFNQVTLLTPTTHTYYKTVTSNGFTLHIIETNASNIRLINLQKGSTLANSGYYGINGGFFNRRISGGVDLDANDFTCHNIALNNGVEIGPNGTGATNGDSTGHAVIAYYNNQIHYCAECMSKEDLKATLGGEAVWAQGGGALKLGDSNWTRRDLCFGDDALVNSRGRTAIVANKSTKKIYLIVAQESTNKSIENFRTAIQQHFGITSSNTDYVGIQLDGGGSSALKAYRYLGVTYDVMQDYGRPLCEIVALKIAH